MIDYAYNFKNSIRFFIHISHFALPQPIDSYNPQNLSWTSPFVFRVRKQPTSYRVLKIPNILNFRIAYRNMSSYRNFRNIDRIDKSHKRMTANLETGDFKIGSYEKQLNNDMNALSIYDMLLKLDIKNYYSSIYTHYIGIGDKERYITNMNMGATNGIIMGNYISLYLAEMFLAKISKDFADEISNKSLNVEFTYFSDDFYAFCNHEDRTSVIHLFEQVLEKYELECNDSKIDQYDYESYDAVNLIDRYYNSIMHKSQKRREGIDSGLYFINQLVYRSSKLNDIKLKNTLILTFFKSKFFQTCNISCQAFHDSEYHQLCWLYKLSPESIIYSLPKFVSSHNFRRNRIIKFFQTRFEQSLKLPYHDEQLYYYIGLLLVNASSVAQGYAHLVVQSNNQVLIAYFLKFGMFGECEMQQLLQMNDEKYWFQSYHLILWNERLFSDLDNSIKRYLLPRNAKSEKSQKTYIEFYKANLDKHRAMIVDLPMLKKRIDCYLVKRHGEWKHS